VADKGEYARLYGHRWKDLRRQYVRLLRRAARVGWPDAKREYIESERQFGRTLDDLNSELEVLDHLNHQARVRGVDPVAAQKRRDLYERGLRPLVVVCSMGFVVARASAGATLLDTLTGALLLCWLGLGTCKVLLAPVSLGAR
jgi:hypothetical protein